MRLGRLVVTGALALTCVAACGETTTEPTDTNAMVQTALSGGGSAISDGADQPALMGRLMHAALGRIRREQGADAARATLDQLKPLIKAVHDARAAHDTAAMRGAMNALRSAEATIIVAALGTEVVTRTIGFANERLTELEDRIAAAADDGKDVARPQALAADLRQVLTSAQTAAAAGDNASALTQATMVLERLHNVISHRRDRHGAINMQ